MLIAVWTQILIINIVNTIFCDETGFVVVGLEKVGTDEIFAGIGFGEGGTDEILVVSGTGFGEERADEILVVFGTGFGEGGADELLAMVGFEEGSR
jgi:hypothetical protein